MMVETIEIGGNSIESLEILSEYSEKERELQVNRRELLKPYILLAVMWSGLIAVTTTIVALTTNMMTAVVSSNNTTVTTAAPMQGTPWSLCSWHNHSMLDFRILYWKNQRRQFRRWL